MKKLLLLLIFFTILLSSCFKNGGGKACTSSFAYITVILKDQANKPAQLDSSYTKIVFNNKILRPFTGILDMTPGAFVLISDSELSQIPENKNTDIRFIGYKGGQIVVDEPFTITQDGCHVHLVSGKNSITINQ